MGVLGPDSGDQKTLLRPEKGIHPFRLSKVHKVPCYQERPKVVINVPLKESMTVGDANIVVSCI